MEIESKDWARRARPNRNSNGCSNLTPNPNSPIPSLLSTTPTRSPFLSTVSDVVVLNSLLIPASMDVITVSELLQRSCPCTSACSLQSESSTNRPPRVRRELSSPVTVDSEFGSSFSTLEVLDRRAVLIGKVVLRSEEFLEICKCPFGNNCLLFLDGGGGICCDILSFDVGVIRRDIRVLSWNYIPFEGDGGFLEIINWEFTEAGSTLWMRPCFGVSSMQLDATYSVHCVDDPKAKYFVHGFVEAVSPVSAQRIEDKENDGGTCSSGFLVDIMSCKCKLCKLKDSEVVFRNLSSRGSSGHCYDQRVTVYLFGSMSSLHPVIKKLAGTFVFLSCLKKKMVFIGRKECQLMYITTRKSFLRVLKLINRQLLRKSMLCEGKSEIVAYTGVIKGIYEQGKIMELDSEVWLLFADLSASLLHSLRVGALIAVQNVHIVKCKFSWTKTIILGVCVKTIVNVRCFSPLATSGCTFSQSPSQIDKFICSLPFSARMWVLLIVASFRKKFNGIFSEREIMGSKHSKGLAQAYASCHLPFSKAKSQNGVFMDFCHYTTSECAGGANYDHLKLVLPISNFIHLFGCGQPKKDTSYPLPDYEGCNLLPVRKIVSSEDINVVLVGMLQISSSTGHLQLVDATGSIDIVIQNLSYNLNAQNLYEVKRYSLLLEELPALVGTSVLRNKLFSLRHIFQYCPPPRVDIAPCVVCRMENVSVVNHSKDWDNDLLKICNGTFDLLKLTHKFPRLHYVDPAVSDNISMFAEVIVLPWNLVITSISSNSLKDCEDGRADIVHSIGCENDQENSYNKRRKCENFPPNGICSSLNKMDGTMQEAGSFVKVIDLQDCDLSYPVQLPCSVHIRSGENHSRVLPGLLNHVKSDFPNEGGHPTSKTHTILLEFKSDSFLQFEALKIGGYYILKNEQSCASSKNNSYTKIVITQVRRFMSLCFSYTNNLNNFSIGNVASLDPCNDVDMHPEGLCQTEMTSLQKGIGCSTTCSDVELLLSSDYKSLLEGDPSHSQAGYFKSLVALHSVPSPLPVGKLISFHGHVVEIISSDQESAIGESTFESFRDHMKYHRASSTCLKIRVFTINGIVRDLICSSIYSFPVGFGPGVVAHFHRILHSRSDDYLLTPVSFVEITSMEASIELYSHELSNPSCAPKSTKFSTFDIVTSCLIHQIIHGLSAPQWIRCRVLAIHVVVFEVNDRYANDQDSKLVDYPDIPLAGFILDDGSCTCCCWANADKAAAFLKMNEEIPWQTVDDRSRNGSNGTCSTVSHHLKKILKKQRRITVKNYGSVSESTDPDMIISIASPKFLDESDEEIVKCVVINACVGKPLNVLASVMDSDAVKQIEKHIREMEMTMPPMSHMWAKEVSAANVLDEARDLFQNLVSLNNT